MSVLVETLIIEVFYWSFYIDVYLYFCLLFVAEVDVLLQRLVIQYGALPFLWWLYEALTSRCCRGRFVREPECVLCPSYYLTHTLIHKMLQV